MVRFNIRWVFRLIAFLCFLGSPALLLSVTWRTESRADVPELQKAEVRHLFDFILHSGCRMVRNGTAHDASEAVDHIQRKYDYYRDEIKTTEDFIDRSASRSTMSGQAYTVECPGQQTRPTAEWLKEELNRYRKQGEGA